MNTKISKVDNKIPDSSKYIITQEFNKWMVKNFAARLKQANLVSKTDFDNKLSFNKWITWNKTKDLNVQKERNGLITKDYGFSFVEFILQVIIDLKTYLFLNQHLIH